MTDFYNTFTRAKKLEKMVLAPECYTTKEEWDAQSAENQADYISWLENQAGPLAVWLV